MRVLPREEIILMILGEEIIPVFPREERIHVFLGEKRILV